MYEIEQRETNILPNQVGRGSSMALTYLGWGELLLPSETQKFAFR